MEQTMSTRLYRITGRVFSVALALTGAILLLGGVKLLTLGGSWWYATAGAMLLASAVLLWRRNRWGAWLYGLVLLATLAWSLWEVGFDPWALAPRLGLLFTGGVWLLTPPGYGALHAAPAPLLAPRARTGVWIAIGAMLVVLPGLALLPARAPASVARTLPDDGAAATEWRHFGNDPYGTRYSALTQIQPANVRQLQLAWSIRTGDLPATDYAFEATPLQVGRLVYVCTINGHVLAVDATNGRTAWHFDPHNQGGAACRGVTYGEVQAVTGPCARRIYTVTPDGKLRALDALTGEPCADFGQHGTVDLLQGLGEVPHPTAYRVTSPPLLTHGRLLVGAAVEDNVSVDMPSGVVRAYDARTGALSWAWDIGRPDRHGAPPPGETYTRSTPNVWAPMVADEAAGLVYMPTGNPSPDFHGAGRRDFDESFGTALVAVEAETGVTRWKFQATHHDLWDFDLGSQPTLFDMPSPQGMQPAVAIGSKSGSIYVLNRLTGAPIVPIVEKPAPRASAVDTKLSATQPESALLVNAGPVRLREVDMWGMTPFDQLYCRIRFRRARYEGPYTPPGPGSESLVYPGMFGGFEWGGLTVDPVNRRMIGNPSAMPFMFRMDKASTSTASRGMSEMRGTGYAVSFYGFLSPLGIPCMQPPWGGMVSIDLDTQKILWQRRVGTAQDSGPFGIASHLPLLIGTPQAGGMVVTRSGLIFSAATLDRYLRAYDLATGQELWKARLPAGGQATPMTYQIDGRQYLVIAAGGHGMLTTKPGDFVQAFALPSP